MIQLEDINGTSFVINCDLIQMVEAIPETKVTLTSGKYYLIANTPEEVIKKVIDFKRQIHNATERMEAIYSKLEKSRDG